MPENLSSSDCRPFPLSDSRSLDHTSDAQSHSCYGSDHPFWCHSFCSPPNYSLCNTQSTCNRPQANMSDPWRRGDFSQCLVAKGDRMREPRPRSTDVSLDPLYRDGYLRVLVRRGDPSRSCRRGQGIGGWWCRRNRGWYSRRYSRRSVGRDCWSRYSSRNVSYLTQATSQC